MVAVKTDLSGLVTVKTEVFGGCEDRAVWWR